jgi:ankyrin repeat protein
MTEARILSGRTPLHKAALDPGTAALELMLDYGAEIMALDNQGMTALHYAVRLPDFHSVVLLLERGGDIDATNNVKLSVRQLAWLGCNDDICVYLESYGDA